MLRRVLIVLILIAAVGELADAQRRIFRPRRPAPSSVAACTVTVANTDDAVSTAITNAANGATICIEAGSATWDATVSIPNTKGLSIVGAGIGSTVITNGLASGGNCSVFEISLASGNALTRVSGFTLNNDSVTCGNPLDARIYVVGLGVNAFRLDHIRITGYTDANGVTVEATEGGELSGVIDSNEFVVTSNTSPHGIAMVGSPAFSGTGYAAPFSRAFELGSSKSIYIEDNYFDFDFQTDGAIDCFGGVQFVFRFNRIDNATIGCHGADSGVYRGPHWFEVYDNVFVDTGTAAAASWFHRGGTGVHFRNDWDRMSGYSNGNFQTFRARPETFGEWGQCDSSSAYDGNQGTMGAGNLGWPCLDQPGWVFDADGGWTGITPKPFYLFLERIDSAPATYTWFGAGFTDMANYHVEGRDWLDEDTTNCAQDAGSCTAGVGVGTLAQRPANCTGPNADGSGGVGWWATDQATWNAESLSQHTGHGGSTTHTQGADGQLYRCTATNTWSLYFTPAAYPHSLR